MHGHARAGQGRTPFTLVECIARRPFFDLNYDVESRKGAVRGLAQRRRSSVLGRAGRRLVIHLSESWETRAPPATCRLSPPTPITRTSTASSSPLRLCRPRVNSRSGNSPSPAFSRMRRPNCGAVGLHSAGKGGKHEAGRWNLGRTPDHPGVTAWWLESIVTRIAQRYPKSHHVQLRDFARIGLPPDNARMNTAARALLR